MKSHRHSRVLGAAVGVGGALAALLTMGCSAPPSGGGRSPAEPAAQAKPKLSPLASAWADRLKVECGDRNPEKIRRTLEGIRSRYGLEKISESDYEILEAACQEALKGNWDEAMRMLGFEVPAEAPGGDAPQDGQRLEVGGAVSVRDIEVPLPEGAEVTNHRPAKAAAIEDDVWTVRVDDLSGIEAFYGAELKDAGWHPDSLMPDCWTKPRPKSTTNEIVCVRIEVEGGAYAIRVSP